MRPKKIKEWAVDDRPREKLLDKGAEALSNAELLALLINTGTKEASAVDVAKTLLDLCDNKLSRLAKLSVQDILQYKIPGIGMAKAVAIRAALSLSVRKDVIDKLRIDQPQDIANYLLPHLAHLQHEVFIAVFINNNNNIISHKIISSGGFTATSVDVRVILKAALQNNAVKIVLAHNHPSGDLTPSEMDRHLTDSIMQAADIMNIPVADHLIISDRGCYSFLKDKIYK